MKDRILDHQTKESEDGHEVTIWYNGMNAHVSMCNYWMQKNNYGDYIITNYKDGINSLTARYVTAIFFKDNRGNRERTKENKNKGGSRYTFTNGQKLPIGFRRVDRHYSTREKV